MEWQYLISDLRFGLEELHGESSAPNVRSDFQRDYDRLVFSSPFRRLQNKTQVFPLPGSIFVHNRLTHSIEVSSVGRSMANEVAVRLRPRYAGEPWAHKLDAISEIVSAACLAHDLGNPPFGHSGEMAISTFFSEGKGRELASMLTPGQWSDLTRFDGNANAFRLLTHRFRGRRPGGFAMTYSTLASIVKYPYASSMAGNKNKFGFFTSEQESFEKVAKELRMTPVATPDGSPRFARHPLVYLVEAADDICYEVMDIEDAHKLGLLPTHEVITLLLGFFSDTRKDHILKMMELVEDPNEKIVYLRSCVIGTLVKACAETFAEHEREILEGTFSGSLISRMPPLELQAYRDCNDLSWAKIYRSPDVVDIELAGTRIITFLLEALIEAVLNPGLNYSRLLLAKVPQQYQTDAPTLYGKIQSVIDHISGMTDVYALDLYRKLNAMSLKINN